MTSSAKIVAVSGVPKRAEKTALMPQSVARRMSLSSRRKIRPMLQPMPPPICSAAPSRPAEPPHRCVSTVEAKMTGTSDSGMRSPRWMESMTALVPSLSMCV